MNKLLKTFIIFSCMIAMVSCTKSEETPAPPAAKIPQILEMAGGIIKIKASETFKNLVSEEIKLDTGENVPDNTQFRIVADDLLMSTNQVDWYQDMLVSSLNGRVTVSVKPKTTPGLYRISLYPVVSDTIKFQANLSARYFVEIVPGDPFVILNVSSEKFEDLSPYNGIKELNESWVISSNPDIITYISVGPVQDKFGNSVSEGQILLNPSEGTVVSANPAPIADGYAYFSYKPTTSTNDLTVTANLSGVDNINLNKSVGMKLVRPDLIFLTQGDFTGMTDGEVRDVSLVLKNRGSQPATNLNLSISAPFVLLPEQTDSCKDRMTLKSQETCVVRVRYTRNFALTQNGYVQAVGQPSNFVTATATVPLIVSTVEPARLVLSQSVISFPQTQCGIKSTLDVFVTNTGSFSATNVNVTQPPASVIGQVPYFNIILPPENITSSDMNAIVDCGNTFPPGRKCRVRLEFQPLSTLPPSPVTGYINADGISSLAVSLSGSSVPGLPTGDMPIQFLKSGSFLPTTSMFASNGQKTIVRVGPLADSCGNSVANGTVISGSVSGGTLSTLVTTTNNGYADFTWNALSKPELMGPQIITLTSNNYSKQATLLFQGVNISVTGLTNWGQVIIEKPRQSTYTVSNSGNVKAENIEVTLSAPFTLIDMGTCAAGIDPGFSCQFIVEARPTANQDYPASIFVSSTTLGVNQTGLSNILIVGRNKPVIALDNTKYLFNDGGTGGTLSRTINITNQGPSVSKGTVITVDSPYSIVSNNCPSDLGVQQTCQIVVSVNRSSSLSAGYKNIYVSNEVETNTIQVTIGFGELQFSTETYTTKKYYCVGPFTIKSVGQNNDLKNLSSTTVVTLDSTTQKVLFYSESSCNTKILTTTIAANTNTSEQFWLRSIAAEINTVTGSFGALPQAQRQFGFEDIRNDVLTFKPAIALKNMACIMCHSSVKGNIVTDMKFPTSTGGDFFSPGLGVNGSGTYIDTTGFTGGSWGGIDMAFGTSYVQGTIFMPKLTFTTTTKNYVQNMVATGKGAVTVSNGAGGTSSQTLYKPSAQTVFSTVADYFNAALINRTSSYLSFLLNWGGGTYAKDAGVSPTSVNIREIKSVNINWPAPNKITSFLDAPGTFKYYKWDDTSADLTNFGEVPGKYFGNLSTSATMICDGDIFVDGIVFLNELKVQTNTGCRIYATKTVFIQAPNTNVGHRQGIQYIGSGTNPNVQISSSKAIMMGLGRCPNVATYYSDYNTNKGAVYAQKYGMMGYRATYDDFPHLGTVLTDIMPDYDKVTDASGNGLIYDAGGPVGGCAPFTDPTYGNNRKVDFSHLLLNAPRVDSRYSGNFSGVLIGGTSIWSLGKFSYQYDTTFDTAPILPFFTPDVFFTVDDCIVNGIDNAISKDTSYKACPTN